MRLWGWMSAVAVGLSLTNPAIAGSDWSGWKYGFQAQVIRGKTLFSPSRDFCFTDHAATGTGTSSASCSVTTGSVVISGVANAGATVNTYDITATRPGPPVFTINAVPGGGETLTSWATADFNGDGAFAGAVTTTTAGVNTARSTAWGGYNFFDFGELLAQDITLGFGAHIGNDVQTPSNWLFGWEADISLPLSNTTRFSQYNFRTEQIYLNRDFAVQNFGLSSARARVGFVFDTPSSGPSSVFDNMLIYATAGIGALGSRISVDETIWSRAGNYAFSDSRTEVTFGPVIGTGIGWKLRDNAFFSAEALYYKFGKEYEIASLMRTSTGGETVRIDDVTEIRVKLSFTLD